MGRLDEVRFGSFIDLRPARPEIGVGLVDGPVLLENPEFKARNLRAISKHMAACSRAPSVAFVDRTFVAGIVSGSEGSSAAAPCLNRTLNVYSIPSDAARANGDVPGDGGVEVQAGMRH